MKKIKAIIFDMDGVLIEAKDWQYEALNQALELFGFTISRYDHLVTFDGLPTRKKLEMLSLEKGLPNGLHKFINHMKQIYTMEHVYMKCKPLFNHQYALSRLKHEGYGLALASNSVRITIDMMMEKADLILLNTCAIRENAKDKVVGFLGKCKYLKKNRDDFKIVLAGCMCEQPDFIEEVQNGDYKKVGKYLRIYRQYFTRIFKLTTICQQIL